MSSILSQQEIKNIRADFPILEQKVYGLPLVYFDNAATTQKPKQVLESLEKYYREYNSNVHRGVHHLSQEATEAYEIARKKIAKFIDAKDDKEIIFTRGTTEGINLVASSFSKTFLHEGDSVLISAMEHHSNIVPWQIACEEKKANLKVIPFNEKGELLLDEFDKLLDDSVKIVAVTYVSNSLGTVNPVEEIIAKAHAKNIPVLLDAAQAVQHIPLSVQKLDVDFLVFSGHKIYGPTGIGVLYGKEEWLNKIPPYQGGGDMIKTVTFEKTIYNELPFKFEAGTPDISGAVALGAAIDYVSETGIEKIHATEDALVNFALEKMKNIPQMRFIGEAKNRSGAISFLLGNAHPFDTGELLDKQGIAVRTGHHCCQPVMDIFNIPGTVRASFAFYNTEEEVDVLVKGIERAAKILI
ncbi:cysteine sulfinate desulfinase [Arachidicoccus ginsenosidimutans]|uniref:aminotransferase class V-fold PLP-dependent enzyme n=1 Tax=Arachidicoccus sp. BS20 TaxID=1850526 RepID=UPI0007F0F2EA|nr:cysteine desulfurase [Arachidicoccus sp. BS20]ANI88916.1 cysteine sulfinate desulfinase [Arachidicoccus sp. BS20]